MNGCNELREVFAQGDEELLAVAGEEATLVRSGSGECVRLRVAASPAADWLELPTVGGAVRKCDRTLTISTAQLTRKPAVGDRIRMNGEVYEVQRATGWAYDASWHVDVCLRRKN